MAPPVRVAVTLEQCWHRVPGGTATAALDAVRALQAGTDLDLVGVAARHRALPPAPWTPPIPVRMLGLPRHALYESWHRWRRPAVERATGSVDLIYVTGMAMPPPSAPLVVTVHDLAFLEDPSHFTRRGVTFFHQAVDLARAEAQVVVCPSIDTRQACVAHGFDEARLRVVPWGIGGAAAEPATEDEVTRVRATYRLTKPYILWTGTIEPRKNLPTLLEAFRRLDRHGVELVLVGPKGWNEDLDASIGSASGRVRVLGFVPADHLRALYAGAEVFCLPSLREGFGLPVLEAMAQGAPVITSQATATAEVGEGAAVLVDPRDAVALCEAIVAVLDDPDRAAALAMASRSRAACFTWSRTAEGLSAAFADARATA